MTTTRGLKKIKQYKKLLIYYDNIAAWTNFRVLTFKKTAVIGEFSSLKEAEQFCEDVQKLQSFVDEMKISYAKNKTEISKMLENLRLGTSTENLIQVKDRIFELLKFNPDFVLRSTFESCSFVMGLVDIKTTVEICFCPEMITIEENKHNPLFQYALV